MNELTAELKAFLCEEGAKLVGCADLSYIEQTPFPYGIAVAVPIPAGVVQGIVNGPTDAYFDAYHMVEQKLSSIVMKGEQFLISRGYSAYAQTSQRIREDEEWKTPLPHKTVATNAGLGWIGKNCLLVTPQYGSAIRLASLLTDAPLSCGVPVKESKCGGCNQCVKACPAHALKGILWNRTVERDVMLDKEACWNMQIELTKKMTNYESEFLCGRCFAVCPYTKKYLQRESGDE